MKESKDFKSLAEQEYDMWFKPLIEQKYKPKWSFIDFKSLEPMVRVLEWGHEAHKDNLNGGTWKDGTSYRYTPKGITESMMRHLMAIMDGEENDPETGLSHMSHIQCNAMFYNYFKRKENEKSN